MLPALKITLAGLVGLLPLNGLRILGYRILFGYHISESKIGFGTVIVVDDLIIENVRIGLFNLFIGPMRVVVGKGTSIGNRNTFACGYWVLRDQYKQSNYTRRLELGEN